MSIQAACDSCGKEYAVHDRFAGKRLRCKQCGESFLAVATDDDGDSDSPPSRRPQPADRRRSRAQTDRSAKPWLPWAVGGALGTVLLVALLVWLLNGAAATHESLTRDMAETIGEVADVLEGVDDETSARAAAAEVRALSKRLAEIMHQRAALQETDPLSREQKDALNDQFREQRRDALRRVSAQVRRLNARPELDSILREPLQEYSAALSNGVFDLRQQVDAFRRESERRADAVREENRRWADATADRIDKQFEALGEGRPPGPYPMQPPFPPGPPGPPGSQPPFGPPPVFGPPGADDPAR